MSHSHATKIALKHKRSLEAHLPAPRQQPLEGALLLVGKQPCILLPQVPQCVSCAYLAARRLSCQPGRDELAGVPLPGDQLFIIPPADQCQAELEGPLFRMSKDRSAPPGEISSSAYPYQPDPGARGGCRGGHVQAIAVPGPGPLPGHKLRHLEMTPP